MDAGMLTYVRDYADLVIGLALLVVAVWVLPGRMRWYVLTAGLAIIGYEFYLRASNRRLLAAADKERENLRARAAALDGRRGELEDTVAELNKNLAENRAKEAALNKEADALAKRGGDIFAEKARLDEESKRRSEGNQELLQKMAGHEDQLAALREAIEAMKQMEAAKSQPGA